MTRPFKARVDELDARGLARDIEQAARDAAEAAAHDIVDLHKASIRSRRAPDGGTQRKNSPGWQRRKGNRPPLEHTGALLNGLRVVTTNDGATVQPPHSRRGVLEELHKHGFETVFTTDETEFVDTVEDALEAEARKVRPSKHVRTRRY